MSISVRTDCAFNDLIRERPAGGFFFNSVKIDSDTSDTPPRRAAIAFSSSAIKLSSSVEINPVSLFAIGSK